MATVPESDGVAARRRAAAIAGHSRDEQSARRFAVDADPVVRAAGLGALARMGALGVADVLAAFTDPAAGVRRRACDLVAHLRRRELTSRLVASLEDGNPSVVEAACHALGEVLADTEPGVTASSCCSHEDLADAVAVLQRTARGHTDPACQEAAVAALGAVGHPSGLPGVLAAMTDKPAVRRRAVVALAAFEGPDVSKALTTALHDRDWQVRQIAEDLEGRRPRPSGHE